MNLSELLFGVLSFLSHVVEAMTGFGATVLSLPFAIALVGVAAAVPVLSLNAWGFSAYVVVSDFRKIVWREYFIVMLFVLLGMPLGMWAFSALPENILKAVLAVFMIFVSANGIVSFLRKKDNRQKDYPIGWKKYALYGVLIMGGIIHGAFSSGGPLLILYVTRTIKEKRQFRATMCAFWFSLNSILLVRNLSAGIITSQVMRLTVITIPFLIAGALIGTWIHKRIPDKYFLPVVFVVLLLSGCMMAYSAFPALIS